MTKGYGINAALNLIGNHYHLNKRQQNAVRRGAASEFICAKISENQVTKSRVKGEKLLIDGFNLIILLESALSGAFIFKSADQTYRDLSGVHGTYKRIKQTNEALRLIAVALEEIAPASVTWLLDKPISNSNRLKQLILAVAAEFDTNWEVILDNNPDKFLVSATQLPENSPVIVSSDGWIIAQVSWFNLGGYLIEQKITTTEIIDFNTLANEK